MRARQKLGHEKKKRVNDDEAAQAAQLKSSERAREGENMGEEKQNKARNSVLSLPLPDPPKGGGGGGGGGGGDLNATKQIRD